MTTGMAETPCHVGAGPLPTRGPRGFTLVELLTVLGLIALVLSLLLPVVGKVQAAANSARCLSNLRQMGTAWTMYTLESRGRLIDYAWYSSDANGQAWGQYWPGVLDAADVRGQVLLCPVASEPSENEKTLGWGNVSRAWTGRFSTVGTVIHLSDSVYRESSYGYNRYLTVGGGFAGDTRSDRFTSITRLSETPVFFDCADVDVRLSNGSPDGPVKPPPNLRGDRIAFGTPDHWKVLLARHGRGVNVCLADGSATWTRLEDVYQLAWRNDWVKYRLTLPAR
jgi:prepilin-type N-terminal cleavage/methylation domain-containing protein/prepilin-type processing-associated H-X9-DG protein